MLLFLTFNYCCLLSHCCFYFHVITSCICITIVYLWLLFLVFMFLLPLHCCFWLLHCCCVTLVRYLFLCVVEFLFVLFFVFALPLFGFVLLFLKLCCCFLPLHFLGLSKPTNTHKLHQLGSVLVTRVFV